MKKTNFLLLLLVAKGAWSQSTVTVGANAPAQVISRHIYGHFAEHLGRCIYGGFYVGDTSKIPNTSGVRNDVVAALKKMKIPSLRWPGGCFADTYHWKDGVGPKEKRPAIVNRWWGGVTEDNSFGTHEFLNMCELIGTEPYLAGNIGSGSVQELTDWVSYVNSATRSPMNEMRKANGRNQPWKVKYWGVGNEAWGCGGNMTPEYYAGEFRKYSTFLTDWTNSDKIFRVASGANVADYHWTETMMKNIPLNLMEGVALHHYSFVEWERKGDAVDFNEEQYFKTIGRALFMDSLVIRHSAIMDKYDPAKKIALVVDEWGGWYDVEKGTNPGFLYQQNTMRDAMIAGVTLNIFNNHSDRVRMACLAQAVNVLQAVILTDGPKMLLTPTYHVMEMYSVHQEAKLLPVKVQTANYRYNGQSLPAVSASASLDSTGVTHVSLVNIDIGNRQQVVLNLGNTSLQNIAARILASKDIRDYNSFDQPGKITPVAFKDFSVNGKTLTANLPPASVLVLEIK